MQNRRGTFLKSPPLTKEFLLTEYVQNGKTTPQIMREFNFSSSKVVKALKKYGIHKPSHLKLKKGNAELKTKEALERMYHKEELPIVQIGELLKMTTGAVTKLFQSRGIPILKDLRYKRVRRNIIKRNNSIAKKRERAPSSYVYTQDARNKCAVTRVRNASQETKRSPGELKARDILTKIGVKFEEQVPFEIYDRTGKLILACCPDFYLKRWGKHNLDGRVIVQIDGALHGRRDEIIERDIKQDGLLTNIGYSVVRICADCLNEENILLALRSVTELSDPAKIWFHAPELHRFYHPAKYIPSPLPVPELFMTVTPVTAKLQGNKKVIIGAKPGYPRVTK